MFTSHLTLGTFVLGPVYVGDRPGGMWLSPTSHLGIGGSLYPFERPSALPPLL